MILEEQPQDGAYYYEHCYVPQPLVTTHLVQQATPVSLPDTSPASMPPDVPQPLVTTHSIQQATPVPPPNTSPASTAPVPPSLPPAAAATVIPSAAPRRLSAPILPQPPPCTQARTSGDLRNWLPKLHLMIASQ